MQLTQGMEDSKSVAKLYEAVERRKTFSHAHWEIIVFGFHKVQTPALFATEKWYLQSV